MKGQSAEAETVQRETSRSLHDVASGHLLARTQTKLKKGVVTCNVQT